MIETIIDGSVRMKVPISQWADMKVYFGKINSSNVTFEGPGTMFGIVENCTIAQATILRLLFQGQMLPARSVPKPQSTPS